MFYSEIFIHFDCTWEPLEYFIWWWLLEEIQLTTCTSMFISCFWSDTTYNLHQLYYITFKWRIELNDKYSIQITTFGNEYQGNPDIFFLYGQVVGLLSGDAQNSHVMHDHVLHLWMFIRTFISWFVLFFWSRKKKHSLSHHSCSV